MLRLTPIAIVSALLAITACTEQVVSVFGDPVPFSVPSGKPAYGPRLSQGAPDTAILSWMERSDDGSLLRFSDYEIGEWQAAKTAAIDANMFVNWADLPSVTDVGEHRLLAQWLSKTADSTYAYQVLTAFSANDGESWAAPISPHTDGTPTEHGFVSVYPAPQGTGLLWLDGRNTPDAGMTLRSATLDGTGKLHDEALVDDRVCDCCQTDVAETAAGLVAVYRNRTNDEIRDIYVARHVDGAWQPGVALHDDGWSIAGCPVNGPAIDADGDRVVVAWFTAANNRPVVRTAVSTNSGKTFSEPVLVASKNVQGHVGIAMIDRHTYAVSWVESGSKNRYEIKLAGMTFDGQTGRPEVVGRTSLSRTVPQLVRAGDELLLAWTDEILDESKIAAVKVKIIGFYD